MARKLWQPKVTRARFVVGALSSDQMLTIADIVGGHVRDRISRGINGDDVPSRALSPNYLKQKVAKGKAPVRDWDMTGRTLQALRTLAASENRANIGFNNPIANRIARWNNKKERAFTLSPSDKEVFIAAVRATVQTARVVTVHKRVA